MDRKKKVVKGPESAVNFISRASSDDGMEFDSIGHLDADEVSRTGTHYTGLTESKASGHGANSKRPDYVDPVVAEKEQKAVFWARFTVILVLLLAVSVLASTMYVIVAKSEKDTFVAQVSEMTLVFSVATAQVPSA
jgi:hypothetical protein